MSPCVVSFLRVSHPCASAHIYLPHASACPQEGGEEKEGAAAAAASVDDDAALLTTPDSKEAGRSATSPAAPQRHGAPENQHEGNNSSSPAAGAKNRGRGARVGSDGLCASAGGGELLGSSRRSSSRGALKTKLAMTTSVF